MIFSFTNPNCQAAGRSRKLDDLRIVQSIMMVWSDFSLRVKNLNILKVSLQNCMERLRVFDSLVLTIKKIRDCSETIDI